MEIILHEIIGSEPLTVDEAVEGLRLDFFDNNEIESLIKSAREAAEDYTRQTFVQKSFYYIFESFFENLYVPKNIMSIESVIATKKDGSTEDITSKYKLIKNIGKITKIEDFETNDIEIITFDLKFDISNGQVPEKVKNAMIWHIINSYHHTNPSEWYVAFKDLLRDIRVTTV